MSDLKGRPEDVIELWTRNGACKIELLSGDITRLSREDKVDIIMVSAFPGDYAAMSGTVIGALKKHLSINVMALSQNKELDLRALFSCWLSKPIEEGTSPFKKLLCFEKKRGSQMNVTAQISEMFRVFVPVFNNQDHTVITPLLATGNQGYSKSLVCGAMVEAAVHWINAGLPLRKLQIVIYEGVDGGVETVFSTLKKKYLAKNEKMKNRIFKKSYDVYITYNPVDQQYMQKIKDNLQKKKTDIKLYTETKHFNQDKVWQDDIFKIMVACKRVIAVLSPAFMESTECLEQYNMAMCCNRLLGVDVLAPFYIDTISSLPSYMGLVQWIDCRLRKEGDTLDGKIKLACANVIEAVDEHDSGDGKKKAFPAIESNVKQSTDKFDFDVFISYSHKNPTHAEMLLETFNKIDPDCKVFYDRSSLTTGTNWQNMLYQSVGECRCFIALLSSTYLSSTVCMEEYSLALARYMCKDKDLMLIPVCIEKIDPIPAHVSTVQMIEAEKDFDETANELAKSVSEWINLTANKRPSEYIVQDPIDIQRIMSAQRCKAVEQQYRVVKKNKKERVFERIEPLVVPQQETDEIDTTKVDIAVSYADDATHLAGSFCVMMDRLYPNFNISVHSLADQERYTALDTAKKIVIFVSKAFLGNENHMQELHLALNRQRPLAQNILYLIQTTPLKGRPFFPRILPYNVSCVDNVWIDLQKEFMNSQHNPDIAKVTVFGKRRRLEHASTFFCSRAEYMAMTKAVEDVLESLLKDKDEKENLCPMLLNVKAIDIEMNGEPTTQNIENGSENVVKGSEKVVENKHALKTAYSENNQGEDTVKAAGATEKDAQKETTKENKDEESENNEQEQQSKKQSTGKIENDEQKSKKDFNEKEDNMSVANKSTVMQNSAKNGDSKPSKGTSKSCTLI